MGKAKKRTDKKGVGDIRTVNASVDLMERDIQYRTFIENSNEMVQSISPDGRFNFVNHEWRRVMGYTDADLKKITLWDIIHPSCMAHCQEQFRKVMEGRAVKKLEVIFIKKDGGLVNVEGSSTPQIRDGKTVATQGFFMDVTERKKQEDALREDERKIKEAQELAHLGYWSWHVRTGEVKWSDEVFKIFQLDPKTFKPRIDSILALSPWPEDHQRDKELIARAMKSHSAGSYEQKFLRPDKSVGYYSSTFQGRYDKKGKLVTIVGTVLDITERKKAEEELQKLSERQKSILGTVPDIIMETDLNKVYTWANQAGYDFFGKDVIGKEAAHYFEGEQKTYDIVQPLYSGREKTIYVESWQRRKDGQKRLLAWWCRPVTDNKKRVVSLLSTARDITEERKTTETIADLARFPSENPNPIIRIRLDGKVIYSNSAGNRVLTKQLGGSIGVELKSKIGKALRSGRIINTEIEVRGYCYLVSIVPFKKLGYVNLYGRDVTERKRVEEEVRFKNIILSTQQESSIDGILIVDEEGVIVSVNQLFYNLMGIPKSLRKTKNDRLILKYVADNMSDPKEFLERVQYLYKHKHEVSRDEIILRDGKIFDRYSVPMLGADKKYFGRVWYFRDVTESKKAENALLESEKRYHLLFSSMQNGFALHEIIRDKNGKPCDYRFIEVNPAFEALTGLKASKIIGKTARLVLPGVEDYWIQAYGKVALTGKPAHLENYSAELGRYYDVQAYCPKPGFFATLVTDVTQRKHDEELIKASEAKFRTVVENIQDMVISFDIQGKVLFVTPNVAQFGYLPEEVLGQSYTKFLFPSDVKRIMSAFKETVKTGFSKSERFRIRKKNGDVVWVEESTRPIWEDGKFNRFVGTIRDISERKQAEEALLQSEEKFSKAFKTSPLAITISRARDGKFIEVNDTFITLTGFTRQELIASSALHLKLWGNPNDRRRVLATLRKGGIVDAWEILLRRKNATLVPCLFSAQLMLLENEVCLIASINDITERKKSEEQLQRSHDELETRVKERTADLAFKNAFLKMELENSLDGILIIDDRGEVIASNRRFAEMWSIPQAVLDTKDDAKMLQFVVNQLKDPDEFVHEVKRLYSSNSEKTRDLIEFKDGRVFDRYTAPLTGDDGKYYGRLWSFRDMSKEAEIDRAKNEFVALASHQLRTPLTGTKWIIQAILERGGLTGWHMEFLQDALKSNDRMIGLVNDLLNISRLDAGVIGFSPQKTEMVSFLSDIIEEVSKDSRAKNLKIVLKHSPAKMIVMLDPALTRQVVMNLLMNAVKYTLGKKTITVTVRTVKDHLEISVKDQGIGISKEDQLKLFDKFFRSSEAERIDTKGSGLGLYIIKKILTVCHGQVVCKSSVGEGATFTVILPLLSPRKIKGERELIFGAKS